MPAVGIESLVVGWTVGAVVGAVVGPVVGGKIDGGSGVLWHQTAWALELAVGPQSTWH